MIIGVLGRLTLHDHRRDSASQTVRDGKSRPCSRSPSRERFRDKAKPAALLVSDCKHLATVILSHAHGCLIANTLQTQISAKFVSGGSRGSWS